MVLTIETPVAGTESQSTENGAERRRGLRIAQVRPVKVFAPAACRFIPGQTEDISATGLRIMLPRSAPLSQGSVLNVHVGLNDFGQPLVNRRQMMPARVVWIDRDASGTSTMVSAGLEWTAHIAARMDAA